MATYTDKLAGTVTNSTVASAAAIAGTKIDPDFGSQEVITTGDMGVGIDPTGTALNKYIHIHEGSANLSGLLMTNTFTGSADSDGFQVYVDSGGDAQIRQQEADDLRIFVNGSEAYRIDSVGRHEWRSAVGADQYIFNFIGSANNPAALWMLNCENTATGSNAGAMRVSSGSTNAGTRVFLVETNGTQRFAVMGDGDIEQGSGVNIHSSDVRLKENFRSYSNSALDQINALNLFEFNYIDNPNKVRVGLIAQEVDQVIPHVVKKPIVDAAFDIANPDTHYKLNYGDIHNIALKAIQELSVENNRLKAENITFKDQLATLSARLDILENEIK